MSDTSTMYKQIQTALTIHRRDFRIAIFGPVLYIVTTISIAIGIVIIRNYLNYIESNGLYPMPDLFSFLTAVVFFVSIRIMIGRWRLFFLDHVLNSLNALFRVGVLDLKSKFGK